MIRYWLYKFVLYFNTFIIIYVLLMNGLNLIQMFIALFKTSDYRKKRRYFNSDMYKDSPNMIPLSILIPAFNEEKIIVDNVNAMLNLNYAAYEVIVINDGSSDETCDRLINHFKLEKVVYTAREQIKTEAVTGIYYNPDYPRLHLIDKVNGGKSDALNTGINYAKYPYFATVDADSILDIDALYRIAMSFMEYKYTVAVGGMVRIINGSKIESGRIIEYKLPRKSLQRFQVTEYLRAFLVGRTSWSLVNSLMIISGAFGAFQKEPVIQVGGYTVGTVGEDMELVLKLHEYMRRNKYQYRIASLPDPVCWTQVPAKIRSLFIQRRRWHIGLIDSLKRHWKMFLNPKYGVLGVFTLPYYLLFEMLAPLVEFLGLIVVPLSFYFGLISLEYLILFFTSTVIFGVILSIGSLAVEEYTFNRYVRLRDLFLLSIYAVIENFSYRQMTVFFRLAGIFGYRKHRESWGDVERHKFDVVEEENPA